MGNHVEVKHLTLDDGRQAERHFAVDENGDEVVEIFAEDKRPKKLEKRIVRKHKRVVDQEIVETVRDGEVIHREVLAGDPVRPLQVVERIGVVDHAKVVDGDYVRKDEMQAMVADAVVAGVSALLDGYTPVEEHHHHHAAAVAPMAAVEPVFKAQSLVAENVAEQKKNDGTVSAVMGGILCVQVVFFIYMLMFVL